MRASSYFLIAISALMVLTISLALTYEKFETKILPLIFSTTVLILGVALLARELRQQRSSHDTSISAGRTLVTGAVQSYVPIAAWLVGLALGIYLVGLLIATPLFVFLYLKLHGRGWGPAIGLAAMFPVFIYGLFNLVMQVAVYPGLLFTFW